VVIVLLATVISSWTVALRLSSTVHSSERGLSGNLGIPGTTIGNELYGPAHRQHPSLNEEHLRGEMHVHALRNAVAVDAESSFRAVPGWNPRFYLYEMDVQTASGSVTLYEAVEKNWPSRRFTAMWDNSLGRATKWELVQ
jgi:hypothetical protein